jgi:hypothetical protein
MKSALHNKILTRGYWQTIIRPGAFMKKRVDDITTLFSIVEKAQVRLRGWYFPHIDYKESYKPGFDWVGQEFEWEHHKSIWRFYQSGLFFYIAALPLDWRDESNLWPADDNWKAGTLLGIGDTVATLTEIFEFAARLALSEAGDDMMHIEILVGNLQDRLLYVDSHKRWSLDGRYQTSMAKFPDEIDIERSSLISSSKDLALQVARDLFKRFRLDIEMETLRSWQEELRA